MNTTSRAGHIFMMLLAMAFGGWYFATRQPPARLDDTALNKTVDTIITRLHVIQYGDDGKPLRTLYTPRLEHIPENGTHRFTNPRVLAEQPGETPVEITANRGLSYRNGEEVIFMDNVFMRQSATSKVAESTMATQIITWFPKTGLAITDAPVIFRQSSHEVSSVGMKAHLNERRVELLHTARGSYAPPAHA